MAIITPNRPDPKYYVNIIQLPDGTWSSDQMALDDTLTGRGAVGGGKAGFYASGLRTLTAQNVTEYAAGLISKYAPPDMQRNALYTLSTQTSGTTFQQAQQLMTWVSSVNSYRDTEIAHVRTLTFAQLQTYTVPGGTPPWPSPPPTVTAVSPTGGPVAGGTTVSISGTNFSGATAVKFGVNNATSVTVTSATLITCHSPAGSAGVVDVTVVTPGGTTPVGTQDHFTYS